MTRRRSAQPRAVRQPLPPRLEDAERRWRDPFVFATVRPSTRGWTVYEVAFAGVRMPSTQVSRRRSYRTLDEAMAAAERRNRLLRKREAAWEASWPMNLDPLPWEQPRELYASDRTDDAVRWHLQRLAARAAEGRPPRRAEEATATQPDRSRPQ